MPKVTRNEKDEEKKEENKTSIRQAVGRFLDDDFWIEPFDFFRSPARLVSRMNRELFPRIDISETDNEIRVVADVPGVDPDEIDIEVFGNKMRITGEIHAESETKGEEKPYRFERSFGTFRREFSLPAKVAEDDIKAVCKDGVLTVILPKVEEEKRKKVKIEKQ